MADILRVWGSFGFYWAAFACRVVRILALMPCSFNGANGATWGGHLEVASSATWQQRGRTAIWRKSLGFGDHLGFIGRRLHAEA